MTTPVQQNNDTAINDDQNDPAQIREKLQKDIVGIITKKLESGDMTEERAKAIAKMTLEKLPEGITYQDLMRVIPTLDDEFNELKFAIFPVIKSYQEKISNNIQQQISILMREKKYEDALNLAKQSIEFESNLM